MALARIATAQRVNRMFRAFSDPTRLRILRLLQGREHCVGDLVTIIGSPQPTISRHLAYLRKAGLVTVRQAGLWKYYRLAPVEEPFQESLLHCLETCFAAVPALQADARRAARLKKSGGCCPT
jgi:ArsR family transcriptional regulator